MVEKRSALDMERLSENGSGDGGGGGDGVARIIRPGRRVDKWTRAKRAVAEKQSTRGDRRGLIDLHTNWCYAFRSRHPWNSGFTCSLFGTGMFTSVPNEPPLK